jgi:hypothetical protein
MFSYSTSLRSNLILSSHLCVRLPTKGSLLYSSWQEFYMHFSSVSSKVTVLERIHFRLLCCVRFLQTCNSLNIVIGYGLDSHGLIPAEQIIFLYWAASRLSLGPSQPLSHWFSGAVSPRVKQLGHEADLHIVLRSRMVELCLHSPICLHGVVLN